MIAIVMTYFSREIQLLKTLDSFRQYDPKDFFVVIVDDGSPEDIILPELPFEVTVLKTYNKTWSQGDPAWNYGFKITLEQNPEIIIIQNAECYHSGNVLNYAKRVTDESYISFGCYSLSQGDAFKVINNRHINFDGESAWYNHPEYWPCGYHFCSAITAKNLVKLNGFDERFSFGVGYDDDDFLNRIKKLGLKIEITSDPFVFHQWHYGNRLLNYDELLLKNQRLYQDLSIENSYKAQHILTSDL